METLLGIRNIGDTLPVNVAHGDSSAAFGEAFKDSRIHFNHFVKVTDSDVINRNFLWKVASRGAGIRCADRHLGVDVILVAVRDHKKPLGPDNILVILLQMMNDQSINTNFKHHLYGTMNPYLLGIFEEEYDPPSITLIRMVFDLASLPAKAYSRKPVSRNPFADPNKTSFTSYDFWCAGMTKKNFPVIEDESEEYVFQNIIRRDAYRDIYYEVLLSEPMETEMLKRSLNPATCKNQDHWNYTKDTDRQENTKDDNEVMEVDHDMEQTGH